MVFEYLVAMFLGLITGSFLNVCIFRIPKGDSILFPASHCLFCKKKLGFYELVPIFSYLFLRGQCSKCKNKISWQYPLIELLTMFLALLSLYYFGFGIKGLLVFVFCSLVLLVAVIDFFHQLIFNNILVVLIVFAMFNFFYSAVSQASFFDLIIGFFVGGISFLLLTIISNGGMGGGDIKYMAILGLCLGWQLLLVVAFVAFVLGGFLGVLFILLKIKKRKDFLPFAPFLSLGALVAVFWGQKIIDYYLYLL